jgi:hypothetical protein
MKAFFAFATLFVANLSAAHGATVCGSISRLGQTPPVAHAFVNTVEGESWFIDTRSSNPVIASLRQSLVSELEGGTDVQYCFHGAEKVQAPGGPYLQLIRFFTRVERQE